MPVLAAQINCGDPRLHKRDGTAGIKDVYIAANCSATPRRAHDKELIGKCPFGAQEPAPTAGLVHHSIEVHSTALITGVTGEVWSNINAA